MLKTTVIQSYIVQNYWLAAGLDQVRELQPKNILVCESHGQGVVLCLWPAQLHLTCTERRTELPTTACAL